MKQKSHYILDIPVKHEYDNCVERHPPPYLFCHARADRASSKNTKSLPQKHLNPHKNPLHTAGEFLG